MNKLWNAFFGMDILEKHVGLSQGGGSNEPVLSEIQEEKDEERNNTKELHIITHNNYQSKDRKS